MAIMRSRSRVLKVCWHVLEEIVEGSYGDNCERHPSHGPSMGDI
jgi:hypothetical protein